MRKVTQQSVNAFEAGKPFCSGNTCVTVQPNVTVLSLHCHAIAYKYNDPKRTLSIDSCGWMSNTTKERLNGITGVSIQQKAGVWYLNGKEWNGELVDVTKTGFTTPKN